MGPSLADGQVLPEPEIVRLHCCAGLLHPQSQPHFSRWTSGFSGGGLAEPEIDGMCVSDELDCNEDAEDIAEADDSDDGVSDEPDEPDESK